MNSEIQKKVREISPLFTFFSYTLYLYSKGKEKDDILKTLTTVMPLTVEYGHNDVFWHARLSQNFLYCSLNTNEKIVHEQAFVDFKNFYVLLEIYDKHEKI